MSRVDPQRPLLPSILDRLIDLDPQSPGGPEPDRPVRLSELKGSLRRDLEWLLNTRTTVAPPPPDAIHLQESLATFGLPDLTNLTLGSDDHRTRLASAILRAVRRFEPRLLEPRVTLVDTPGSARRIQFRIDGLLRVEPHPEAISFDSALELPEHGFRIQEA